MLGGEVAHLSVTLKSYNTLTCEIELYHENVTPTDYGYWVEAKDLRTGDTFLGANGELSTLTNIVRLEQEGGIAIFNFTVEGNHNYFILAKEYEFGQSCVLVHNNSIPWSSPEARRAAKELRDKLANGAKNPSVVAKNRSHAEEIFLREYYGKGYRNTTGWDPTKIKEKNLTYHWDDAMDAAGRVHELGNPHGHLPHLQFQTPSGVKVTIFYNP